MAESRSLNELPSWLRATVTLAQHLGCSFGLNYVAGEDLWYAYLHGAGSGESWEVKRWETARAACEALIRQLSETIAPNGLSYHEIYADALAVVDPGEVLATINVPLAYFGRSGDETIACLVRERPRVHDTLMVYQDVSHVEHGYTIAIERDGQLRPIGHVASDRLPDTSG